MRTHGVWRTTDGSGGHENASPHVLGQSLLCQVQNRCSPMNKVIVTNSRFVKRVRDYSPKGIHLVNFEADKNSPLQAQTKRGQSPNDHRKDDFSMPE